MIEPTQVGACILGRKTVELMTANHMPNNGDLSSMGMPVFSETPYDGIGFGLGVSVMLDPAKAQILGSPGEYAWGGAASTAFWVDPVEEQIVIFLTQLMPSATYPIRRELRVLSYGAIVIEDEGRGMTFGFDKLSRRSSLVGHPSSVIPRRSSNRKATTLMAISLADPNYVGDLGNGLICRWSTRADCAKIGDLLARVYRDGQDDPLNLPAGDEARVFMSEGFPLMGAGDIAVVEDCSKPDHPIVACTCCWRRVWSYGGIPFGVGQPENVATDVDYRNRGLVRALFAMFHARSAAAEELVQAITGIPYFYRQFGYEYVLDLGGRRFVEADAIAAPSATQSDKYHLRLATLEDIPSLLALYNQRRHASLVWQETDEAYWRYHVTGWADPAIQGRELPLIGMVGRLYMIVDDNANRCGYTWLATKRWDSDLAIYALEFAPHVNGQVALAALLPQLRIYGEQSPPVAGNIKPFRALCFHLGRSHPVYDLLGKTLAPRAEPPYAWYLRVSNLPAFLRQIAPVLEARLAASVLTGHIGELKIDFYRAGLHLRFEQGKLITIETWQAPPYGDNADAGCPALTFLQLLFGYRSLAELRAIFPDVWANDGVVLLINTLFPAQPSTVYSLTFT